MNEIHYRSVDEIMNEIRSRAAAYTPEWHLDRRNPDIGTALAEVYASIQNGLDRKYLLLSEKLKVDYFNCLNVSMKTAQPAEGYAVFDLTGEESEETVLQTGTLLRCDASDERGEAIPVELSEDICVVPDTIEAIYETNGARDYIGRLFDTDMEERSAFPLFGMSAKNEERHIFYLSHPWLFRYINQGRIVLKFLDEFGQVLPDNVLSRFADPQAVRFFYESGEEAVQFLPEASVEKGCIYLKTDTSMAEWTEAVHGGVTGCWLGCEIMDIRGLESFAPSRILLGAGCPAAKPDSIYAAGTDQSVEDPVFAFGEQFSVFDEIYFGSGNVLSKKGAEVELSFNEEFVRIPIETEEEPEYNWKLIMKKEQFRQEKEYDITIEEVIWEYYNGSGWARLFPASEYRDVFSPVRGLTRQIKKLKFICPEDLEPVLAGSGINFCIRARILKVNNAFRTKGQYLSPVISDVMLSCSLDPKDIEPEYYHAINHLEENTGLVKADRLAGRKIDLIEAGSDAQPSMYVGFRIPPMRGPVRILWETGQILAEGSQAVRWEYYKNGAWVSLHPADGTESFRMTGTVTFSGIPDAERKRMFGRDLYWIRAVNVSRNRHVRDIPEIRAWYMNAARVETIRHGLEEYLTMESYEEGVSFRLLSGNIHDLEVWVREDERLHFSEVEALTSEGRYREVLDENGVRNYAWIRWKRTDNLKRHSPGERVYMLDENDGVITFGGGTSGKLPAPGVNEGIHVLYSIGGGKSNCLPEHSINGLELSGGSIGSVTNPMPLYGAYDRETTHTATRRAACEYRTGMRAVSEHDFEELALGAMGNLRKARCFSNINAAGQAANGAVTLVLMSDDYMDRSAGFEMVKKKLYDWFSDKIPAYLSCGGNFRIREPELVEISLQIEASIVNYQELYRIQKTLLEKLEQFLHPVKGNFDGNGWYIGSLPERFQIETVIRSTEGIEGLRRCVVLARLPKQPGCPMVDFDEIRHAPFVLPVNGEHRIRLALKD